LRLEAGLHVQQLGFERWIHANAAATPRLPYLFGDFPRDWLAHYERLSYFDVDPVVHHCRQHTTPCLWSVGASTRLPGHTTEFFREAADFGLRSGVGLPIHGPGGHWSMVSVATGSKASGPPPLQALGQLHLLAAFVHEAGQRFTPGATQETVHLTVRELDSLRWAAEGKTSWEIGQLIGIAECTVIFHLNNAAKKLGVIGRRQAVTRAIALQLIVL
jgi:DNA-binding CsgD family transcriptional regulator